MTKAQTATLSFYGGVGTTTGSNFLLSASGITIMIDCGLIQGAEFCMRKNFDPFPYDISRIAMVFVTHAHLDHIGRLPRLVRDGYHGPIYSTEETKALAELIFEDALSIMEHEHRASGTEFLYERTDIEKTLSLWKTISYHDGVECGGGMSALLKDAGHILGSAMVEVTVGSSKIVFSGDLGNSPAPFLPDTERITDATYMVLESVYGDRVHESVKERQEKLEDIVETTIRSNGVLLIPAFSIDRSQILLYELNGLVERGRVPAAPVFLDSPLAIKATEVYRSAVARFNRGAQKAVAAGDDIFNFPKLMLTESVEDSKAILKTPNPKIIIAGSGMSNGGRILGHERAYLEDPSTTLLFVGFQAAGTLGRKILDGVRTVTIGRDNVRVRARIRTIFGYSAHRDMNGLLDFVDGTAASLRKAFITMGETRSSLFLAQRMRDYLGINATVPKEGDSVILDV